MKNLFNIILIGFIFMLSACFTQEAPREAPREPQVWVPGWKITAALVVPRAGSAVVEANGYIYMIAGFDGQNILKSTEYARIQDDGSLGPWKAGPELNEERGFLEATVYNGSIYVVGGANAPDVKNAYASNLLASVERAHILPDGSLGPWVTEKNSMMIPRRCNKVVHWGNHIYSVGGYGGVMLDSIDRAEILADGSVGKWVLDKEKMVLPHYVNGVKAKKGALYVIAGHDENKGIGIKDVEWSKILEGGGLSPWKKTSPLRVGRYGLATASYGDYFYAIGGFTGRDFLKSIEKASLKPDGELSEWEFTSSLSSIRLTFSVIVYKDWIYLIGGGTDSVDSLTTVEYASFNDEGDIGYWGADADLAAHKKKAAEKEAAPHHAGATGLEYEGVVIEFIQTDVYSYIQVSGESGKAWLAVPKIEPFDVSTRIEFNKGLLMRDFYSEALDRKFPKILFVSEVKRVE